MRGIASLYGKTGDGKKEPGQFFNYVSLCFLLIMPYIILNMELFRIPWWHGAIGFITKQQPRQSRRGCHSCARRRTFLTGASPESARYIPSRQKDTLEISKKTKASGGSTTGQRRKFIKSSCCMRSDGTS